MRFGAGAVWSDLQGVANGAIIWMEVSGEKLREMCVCSKKGDFCFVFVSIVLYQFAFFGGDSANLRGRLGKIGLYCTVLFYFASALIGSEQLAYVVQTIVFFSPALGFWQWICEIKCL